MYRLAKGNLWNISQRRCFSTQGLATQLLNTAKLRPGDVIVQNGADSETGRGIIRLAKDRGVKTLNIVADKPGTADVVEELKALGADIVVTESYTNTWYVKRLLSELPKPVLGVNCSDGPAATSLAKLLGAGAKMVTYGKELPSLVSYAGAEKRPVAWSDYLKSKKISASSL
eukprot:TRINITY_DN20157_c0_g1_i1.p1 TRINITY_DN20157_c0_g1~~TRINITY_DN20157_c0_g1_i1.p1  ORF type:complete len:172 (+),score=38.83 TRINITY_DN20157_c0_g1_i1:144-659(+)